MRAKCPGCAPAFDERIEGKIYNFPQLALVKRHAFGKVIGYPSLRLHYVCQPPCKPPYVPMKEIQQNLLWVSQV
jgi:hypothetical protein